MSSKRSRAAFESDDAGPPPHASYALYGTPLPAYDSEARDDGSYVPIWKQEVTDERGRKRLHGAFTGGYSAGYFNTVGSKEGWAPSTFVSSRSNRAKNQKDGGGKQRQQMRPEDFMDDEDLAEQGEAQQLETQGTFAGLGSASEAGGGKATFADLFKTTGETMGVKLLQRMGWRQGQGLGPKVKRRAQGDQSGEMHAFAPENTRMIAFSKKNDRKGLGFAGESSLDAGKAKDNSDDDSDVDARILSANRRRVVTKPKKAKMSSFGVGVLNDTGSDDEDPYAVGPPINYTRIFGADKRKRKGGLVASTTVQRPTVTSKKPSQRSTATEPLQGFRRCHDGRLPLVGFLLSNKPLIPLTETNYPPPTVPDGWKPARRATKFDVGPDSSFQSTADAAKASTLDIKSRAALLGEAALPGKSVFDFLKPSARDALASASGRADLPQARGESAPEGFEGNSDQRTLWDLVPALDSQTAAAALARGRSGWMPYGEDPGKRDRYAAFLSLHAGESAAPTLPDRPKGLSQNDWSKELREFAQAAEVFKPISGLMASRFTSSTSSAPKLASDAPDAAKPAPKPDDAAVEAAKAGMFGPLTRKKYPFYPARLLCKRFNVKAPANVGARDGGDGGSSGAEKSNLVNSGELQRMMMHANFGLNKFAAGGKEGGEGRMGGGGMGTEEVVERADVDAERNEALEGERPGREVFRSVFED